MKLTLHLISMCPQWASIHMYRPMISLIPRDMQRLSHLKVSWMNRRCSGRQLILTQNSVTHEVPRKSLKSAHITRPLPSSRRQAPVQSESLSDICDLVHDAKVGVLSEECGSVEESRGSGTRFLRDYKATRWQRSGQRNQRRKRAIICAEVRTGNLGTMTSSPAPLGRSSHDVSRWEVENIAPEAKSCEGTRSTREVSNRPWDVPQICKGARAPHGRRQRSRRCPGCVFERLLSPVSSASP